MPANLTLVNIIPQSLSGETNFDSEPNLAVDPANPSLICASAFTPNPAGSGDAPIYVSSDGGNTWSLQAIVPSDQMTADITLRFSANSNLYAGIIRTPIQNDAPRLNILRSTNVLSGVEMTVLVDRTGQGVDQPYIQVGSAADGQGGTADVVVCGDNDFNQPSQTATLDFSASAASSPAPFSTAAVDVRAGNGDAPSIRPAIHADGTVYAAFLSRTGGNDPNFIYNVVVTRDDQLGQGAPPFGALTDPSDGLAGVLVATNRLIPFINQPVFGQERIGSTLTIGVDPRAGQSGTVFLAWADRVSQNDYTIHLVKSTDRGQTWSADLLTITNATNPAVAVNTDGVLAFVYQQLTGPFTPNQVSAANRWVTHLQTSTDMGTTWNDLVLATTPANQPPNPPPGQVQAMLPYLGDYLHLMAAGSTFYGIFSANNTPDPADFPNGVVFQRNHDMNARTLFDVDGVTPVDISIDPFFFKLTP